MQFNPLFSVPLFHANVFCYLPESRTVNPAEKWVNKFHKIFCYYWLSTEHKRTPEQRITKIAIRMFEYMIHEFVFATTDISFWFYFILKFIVRYFRIFSDHLHSFWCGLCAMSIEKCWNVGWTIHFRKFKIDSFISK